MALDNIALHNPTGTDTAVIWALGSGEALQKALVVNGTGAPEPKRRPATYILGPAIRPVVQVQEGVFLLQAEPGYCLGMRLHELGALMAEVVLVGGSVVVPALGQDTGKRVSTMLVSPRVSKFQKRTGCCCPS